ncbi:MAG: PQQ-binding-like beta-propeller repeat protein [Bacteroidales bacterium]|nr:PQQ-binding-like beta-propeller repeat protein [Bacteroidales bacterium]
MIGKLGMLKKLGYRILGNGVAFLLLIVAQCAAVQAQDTQWRGPERDGKYHDTGLLKQWPEGDPELILKKEGLGNGYSTPILHNGMVYISGRRDSRDVVTKLDTKGNVKWETVCGNAWNQSFPETRSTPTIEDDRLYIMGGLGTVVCMEIESGDIIWKVNTHEEYGGEFHIWGMAESLLLTGDAVISSPVGNRTAVVALDKKDGSLLWETGKVMYEEKWYNKGSIIYADGLLYVYEEKRGHVGLVEPTPEGFRVISSFKIDGGSGPHWAHMSIYDKKLFIRHGEVLFVYDIAL